VEFAEQADARIESMHARPLLRVAEILQPAIALQPIGFLGQRRYALP
jgi:hypothetical protein